MAWQHILPEVIVMGFTKCCIPNSLDEAGDMLWNGSSDEDGNVSSVRNLTIFVYYVYKINSKVFFLSRHFTFGVLS